MVSTRHSSINFEIHHQQLYCVQIQIQSKTQYYKNRNTKQARYGIAASLLVVHSLLHQLERIFLLNAWCVLVNLTILFHDSIKVKFLEITKVLHSL